MNLMPHKKLAFSPVYHFGVNLRTFVSVPQMIEPRLMQRLVLHQMVIDYF